MKTRGNNVTFARAVALLMTGPRTTRDLADELGVGMDAAMRYTRTLRSFGLIYTADWTTRGRVGPRMPLWTWQGSEPFAAADCPRPRANDSRKLRRIAREERAARALGAEETMAVAEAQPSRVRGVRSVFDLGSAA